MSASEKLRALEEPPLEDPGSIWCDHCQDHFGREHYPNDRHGVGNAYGYTGQHLALANALPQIRALVEAAEYEQQRYRRSGGAKPHTDDPLAALDEALGGEQ